MMRRAHQRALSSRERGDDGVALALALVFVMVMALTVTALLPYTSTGLKAASAVRDVRTVQNAADGAVDQAINSIRGSFDKGASPVCSSAGPFPTYDAKDYANPFPDTGVTKVRVKYCNDATSTAPTDQPPYAIQTLTSGNTTAGLAKSIDIDGNAPLVVSGGVLSNGNISATGSAQSIDIEGDLYATGDCNAKSQIFVSGIEHCANTTPPYASASDPDASIDPLAALPEPTLPSSVDAMGVCSSGSLGVVTFSPGFYTETPMPDPSSCTGPQHTVWWFQPGTYYFDFPDSTFKSPQFGDYTNSDASWTARGITIVGGTPANWNPATDSSAAVENLFKLDPDHANPSCAEGSPGVVFAFGGPKNISVGTGGSAPDGAEICSGNLGTQHLSLYGLRSGSSRSATSTTAPAVPATAATPVGVTPYLPTDAARQIDAVEAMGELVGGLPATSIAKVSLGAFPDISSAIPDGSIITSAQLRLNYWTTSLLGTPVARKVDPSVTYQSDVYPATTVHLATATAQPALNAGAVVPLPLAAGVPRWKAVEAAVKNLAITFTADGSTLNAVKVTGSTTTPAETATSHLDGVQLEVGYIPPAVETTRCFPGISVLCNIVTNKNPHTMFLHGSVYAPKSIVEAEVHNYTTTVFERGIIAAAMVVHVSASVKQTLPPFQLPKGSHNRVIRFTAESLEPDGTWRTRVVALVQYDDFLLRPDGKSTAAPGHRVSILKWTVMR